jgi:hypothetical protein
VALDWRDTLQILVSLLELRDKPFLTGNRSSFPRENRFGSLFRLSGSEKTLEAFFSFHQIKRTRHASSANCAPPPRAQQPDDQTANWHRGVLGRWQPGSLAGKVFVCLRLRHRRQFGSLAAWPFARRQRREKDGGMLIRRASCVCVSPAQCNRAATEQRLPNRMPQRLPKSAKALGWHPMPPYYSRLPVSLGSRSFSNVPRGTFASMNIASSPRANAPPAMPPQSPDAFRPIWPGYFLAILL